VETKDNQATASEMMEAARANLPEASEAVRQRFPPKFFHLHRIAYTAVHNEPGRPIQLCNNNSCFNPNILMVPSPITLDFLSVPSNTFPDAAKLDLAIQAGYQDLALKLE
jgi:hypothetical protein